MGDNNKRIRFELNIL